jgi:hypothetical protein
MKEPVKKDEDYKVGDDVVVYGSPAKVTGVDGTMISFEGEGGSGAINIAGRGKANIKKQPSRKKQLSWSDVARTELNKKDLNAARTAIRNRDKNSYSLQILDEVSKAMRDEDFNLPFDLDYLADGITYNDVASLVIDEGLFETLTEAKQFITDRIISKDLPSRKKQLGKKKDSKRIETIGKAKASYDKAIDTGKNPEDAYNAAVNALENSSWYQGTNDIQREAAVRGLRKELGIKEESSPSVAKILGKPKDRKITVNERVVLAEKLKAVASADKKGALKEKKARRKIAADLMSYAFKGLRGKVNATKLKSVVNKALKMNLSDPVMAQRFFDYVDKIVSDIKYDEKLKKAYSERKSIKRLSKNQQLGLSAMAINFVSFDPVVAEDIDKYLEMAEKVKSALRSTRVSGLDIIFRGRVNIEGVNRYTNDQIARQDRITKDMLELKYPELFESGLLDRNSSLTDIRIKMSQLEMSEITEVMDESDIRKAVEEHISRDRESLSGALSNLYDYSLDEDSELSKADVDAIKDLLELDPSKLSVKDLFRYADTMANVAANLDTGSLAAFAGEIKGIQNAEAFFKANGKSRVRTEVGRQYLRQLGQLDLLLENVFSSQEAALEFYEKSGLSAVSDAAVSSQIEVSGINIDYKNKFFKNILKTKRPNGKSFDHVYNIYERGMYAFLVRNSGDSDISIDKEFQWRKQLIIDSINYLEGSTDNIEKGKGKVYREVGESLGLFDESTSILDIDSRVDKVNKAAHKYWVDTYGKYRSEMAATARVVYNKDLKSEHNYTPDRFKKRAGKYEKEIADKISEGQMETGSGIYLTESGALMDRKMVVGSSRLPSDRYVDLDFDNNNSKMLEEALIDARTAAAIRQLKGFLQSSSFEKMIPIHKTRNLVSGRIWDYVSRKRKKGGLNKGEIIEVVEYLSNTIAKTSTVYTLASVGQTAKQTLPVYASAATYLAIGGNLPGFSLKSSFDKEYIEWLGREGSDLALRGLEAQLAIDKAELNLERMPKEIKKLMKAADGLGQVYLEAFLKHPDLYVARATWLGFYKAGLKKYGGGEVDFSKPSNKKAKRYADLMVNRMQNTSDPDKAGNLWTNKETATSLLRKTNFTFANFILNQKVRQYTDVKKLLTSKNWRHNPSRTKRSILKTGTELHNIDEVVNASKSLATIGVELAAYHILAMAIRGLYQSIAGMPFPDDEEQEDKAITRLVREENKRRVNLPGDQKLPKMSTEEERVFREDAMKMKIEGDSIYEKFMSAMSSGLETKDSKTMLTSAFKDFFSPLPQTDKPLVWLFNEGFKSYTSKNIEDEIQQELEIEAILHAERGKDLWSDAMTHKREEIKNEVIERNAFQFWDFNDDSYASTLGTLGFGIDVYKNYYGVNKPMADDGYYFDDRKNEVRYLSKEDQEIAKETKFWEGLRIYGITPSDVGSIMRYQTKRLKSRSFNATQIHDLMMYNSAIEKANEKYGTNFSPITDEEKIMVSRGSGSFEDVLKKTRKDKTGNQYTNERILINLEKKAVEREIKTNPEIIENKALKKINEIKEAVGRNK